MTASVMIATRATSSTLVAPVKVSNVKDRRRIKLLLEQAMSDFYNFWQGKNVIT